jgi:CDP-diglyceride synthetase
MPNLDVLKASLSFAEKIFFSSLAIIFTLVWWMFGNYADSNEWLLGGAFLLLVLAVTFGVLFYRYIKRLIEEIGEC